MEFHNNYNIFDSRVMLNNGRWEDLFRRLKEQHKVKAKRFKPCTWYSVIYKGRRQGETEAILK